MTLSLTAYHYILAGLPIVIWFILWLLHKQIVWWEWAIGALTSLVIAGVLHYVGLRHMVMDKETFSGHVTKLQYIPEWRESYKYTTTHKVGKVTTTSTHTGYTNHSPQWLAETTLGTFDIPTSLYNEWSSKWGVSSVPGTRTTSRRSSKHVGGDANDYISTWKTGQSVLPATDLHSWENRVKASPSKFDFPYITEKEAQALQLYTWPTNPDRYQSSRRMGPAAGYKFSTYDLDILNSKLGMSRGTNLIFVNLTGHAKELARKQEAYWVGGKKNELVICFGADWVYAFGWVQDRNVLTRLENATLPNLGNLDSNYLNTIQPIILKEWKPRDWNEFNHLEVPLPLFALVTQAILQVIIQTILYFWATNNYNSKNRY